MIKVLDTNLFPTLEEKEDILPNFITHEYLSNIDLADEFFTSLKNDYKNFIDWYQRKAQAGDKAYVTRDEQNKITSFLKLKIEDENEDYSCLKEPFSQAKRLKIATFKVASTGHNIGDNYLKIIINEALKNKVNEIYVTVFPKYKTLINLLLEYCFTKKTTKLTEKSDSSVAEEFVYVKNMTI